MKKWVIGLILLTLVLPSIAHAEEINEPELTADAAILYNVSTDEILYEKNADEKIPTGSITKIMTMLLASEAIERGDIKKTDSMIISERAWREGHKGSSMFLEVNQKVTVDELMMGLAVASGNDAAVQMAEYISGNVEDFVKLMNKRAKELKMNDTIFKTPSGLQFDLTETTTARDFLTLSKYYWDKFPKNFKEYHSQTTMQYATRPDVIVERKNENRLLSEYSGTNGLKTGWIGNYFNIVATVNRDGMKMIAVVLGSDSSSKRTTDTIRLFEYGQKQYKVVTRNKANDVYSNLSVYKSTKTEKSPVVYKEDVKFVVRVDVDPESLRYEYEGNEYLVGGIKEGEVIGTQKVYQGEKLLTSVDIVATETLEKGSGLSMFFDSIAIFFNHTLLDLLSSILDRGE